MSTELPTQTTPLAGSAVEVHNHSIYGKLGLTIRTQAVAQTRELGLLQRSDTGG